MYTWKRPASITIPGGSKKDCVYDPLMRVQNINAKDPGQNSLLEYQYTYDKMDNITGKDAEHGHYDYGYDDLYRLINVDNPEFDDEAYTYDEVGNRLTTASGVTWTYNDNNELLNSDGASYEYDDNGNMVKKTVGADVTNYLYNVEDRLARVEDGTGTVIAEYYYDPFGKRLWKEVGVTRTYFLYTDEGLVGEYDSSGSEIRAYGYVPGSTWTTAPLFMKEGDNYYFYQNDHLGTPQKITAINGAVVWGAKYTSFGEATIEPSSTITNNLRFPGQYYDEETGLHYNYHRYYHSDIGRYLRTDPIIKGYDISRQEHTYTYTMNNPIVFIDPMGLAFCVFSYSSRGFASGLGYEGTLECVFENNDPRCCGELKEYGAITGMGDRRRYTSETNGPIPTGFWKMWNVGEYTWGQKPHHNDSYLDPQFKLPNKRGGFFIHKWGKVSEGCIAVYEKYDDLKYCLEKDDDSRGTGFAGWLVTKTY